MLTISTWIFTTIDSTNAVVSQKYWVSVNYVGVGRFAVALGTEMVNFLNDEHDIEYSDTKGSFEAGIFASEK